MKIVIITGSPHRNGTSALLAGEFVRGAEEAGHTVVRFDAGSKNVSPCMGCEYCRSNDSYCVFPDDMEILRTDLLDAEMVVLATPLYYFGMSAQLKRVIDRFYAINSLLRSQPKKAMLLATGADGEAWAMEALMSHYRAICRYLNWEDCGSLLALGVYHREDIERTDYPRQAYELGKGIR